MFGGCLFGSGDNGRTPFEVRTRAWDQGMCCVWARDSGLLGLVFFGLLTNFPSFPIFFRGFSFPGETGLGAARPYCVAPRGGGILETNLEAYSGWRRGRWWAGGVRLRRRGKLSHLLFHVSISLPEYFFLTGSYVSGSCLEATASVAPGALVLWGGCRYRAAQGHLAESGDSWSWALLRRQDAMRLCGGAVGVAGVRRAGWAGG